MPCGRLLSAVAFGAAKNCLHKGRCPTINTNDHLILGVESGHRAVMVERGPKPHSVLKAKKTIQTFYRTFRGGGAFGDMSSFRDTGEVRDLQVDTRTELRLPRQTAWTVPLERVARLESDVEAHLCDLSVPVYLSTEQRGRACSVPGGARPPRYGADAKGEYLDALLRDGTADPERMQACSGLDDGIDLLVNATGVKEDVTNVIYVIGFSHEPLQISFDSVQSAIAMSFAQLHLGGADVRAPAITRHGVAHAQYAHVQRELTHTDHLRQRLRCCHATIVGESKLHRDVMGPNLEDKFVLPHGKGSYAIKLGPSGTEQAAPQSTCGFEGYGVGVLISGAGPKGPDGDDCWECDGDVEVSCATAWSAMHGTVGIEGMPADVGAKFVGGVSRGAYVRSCSSIHPGGVACCDHEKCAPPTHTFCTCAHHMWCGAPSAGKALPTGPST